MQLLLSDLELALESVQLKSPPNAVVRVLKSRASGSSSDFAYAVISAVIDVRGVPITVSAVFLAGPQPSQVGGWYFRPEVDHKSSGIALNGVIIDDLCDEGDEGWMKPISVSDHRLRGLAEDCWSYWEIEQWMQAALPPRVKC
jgi:hypothetical protein